jgi:hypothetical protein
MFPAGSWMRIAFLAQGTFQIWEFLRTHHLAFTIRDVTGGFRFWKSAALRRLPLDRVRSNGYVFQVEMAYLAYLLGVLFSEIPSILPIVAGAPPRCPCVFRSKRLIACGC